jgi:hypothetical protein
MKRTAALAALAVVAAMGARADLTLRHTFSFQLPSYLPPDVKAQVQKQIDAAVTKEMVVHVKGEKAYASYGPMLGITDFSKNELTLLNPKTKQYATIPLDQYADRFGKAMAPPALPPAAQQLLESLKVDVQNKKTGKVAMIEGIRAEESLITISMELPSSGAAGAMRMEMRVWSATPDEIRRVPALKEMADYAARTRRALDPAEMLTKGFEQMPGVGAQLRAPLEQLTKINSNLVVRMRMGLFIPAMTQMVQLSPNPPAGFDPNAPITEYRMDLAEVSTASVPDSTFAIPKDYTAAPFEDIVKAMRQVSPAVPAPPPARKQ